MQYMISMERNTGILIEAHLLGEASLQPAMLSSKKKYMRYYALERGYKDSEIEVKTASTQELYCLFHRMLESSAKFMFIADGISRELQLP